MILDIYVVEIEIISEYRVIGKLWYAEMIVLFD